MRLKSILLTAVVALGLTTATMAQIPNYVPTTGLVGWWPFNGNANDESGNGYTYTGTINSFANDRFGVANKAFDLTNQTSAIYTNYNGIMGQNPRTVNLWFKVTGSSGNDANFLAYGGGFGAGWNMRIEGLHPTIDNSNSAIQYNPVVITQTWNMLTATYDVSFGTNTLAVKLYLNGVLLSNIFNNYNGTQILNTGSGNPVLFGVTPTNSIMDDVGMWNRVLSQQEITDLYNGVNCSDTTVIITQTVNVSDASFQNLSPKTYLENIDSLTTSVGGCDSIVKHYINYVYNANYCTDTAHITVTDTLIINRNMTGINPVTYENTIKIFPNPANDVLNMNFGTNFSTMNNFTLEITNSLSQSVYSTVINSQNKNVNISSWANGVYFVYLRDTSNNVVDMRKIVIQ